MSEFIEEKDGYLALSDEQYEFEVANTDENVNKSARAILEIGEHREGYWNNDRFMEQMVKIAEWNIHYHKATPTSGVIAVATLHLLMMP